MSEQKGLLQGTRIIEWGGFLNGVGAGYMLGDLGAEVIKVEEPGRGDPFRGLGVMYGDVVVIHGRHIGFETANRNKKSISLDLKNPKGKEIFYQLIENADVLLTNFSKDLARTLQIDYLTLRRRNPSLVYASASGFGSKGPEAGRRSFDTIAMAKSGFMWAVGDRDSNEPVQSVGAIFDQMGATVMAYGIVSALFYREKTGVGQEIEMSLYGSALHLQAVALNVTFIRGRPLFRHTRSRSKNPLANHYRCADGEWLMLAEVQSDRFWSEFCAILGINAEVEKDPRFATDLKRRENCVELIAILDRIFATNTRGEWLEAFQEGCARFAYAPIYRHSDLANDPQALTNSYLLEIDHPAFGKVKEVGFPVSFSETPPRIQREAPELGQHTEEILMDICGYDWDKINALRAEGIV